MITGKQRSFLRGKSTALDCTFQIGKNGITENTIKQYDEYLVTRELVKTHILRTNDELPRNTAQKIADAIGADVVSVVGRKFVLYRRSEKLVETGNEIRLPR